MENGENFPNDGVHSLTLAHVRNTHASILEGGRDAVVICRLQTRKSIHIVRDKRIEKYEQIVVRRQLRECEENIAERKIHEKSTCTRSDFNDWPTDVNQMDLLHFAIASEMNIKEYFNL